jgi:hypothetical protein
MDNISWTKTGRRCAVILSILVSSSPAISADYVDGAKEGKAASQYCSNYNVSDPATDTVIHLGNDKRVMCFDGVIRLGLDEGAFRQLTPGGIFVIRSWGGYAEPAITMSNILLEKGAKVVIRDYCLSACANYVFVASGETYVQNNALIAWHGGPPKVRCLDVEVGLLTTFGERRAQLEAWDQACNLTDVMSDFFAKRGLDDRFLYEPQTSYSRKIFDLAVKPIGAKTQTYWMWHPQIYWMWHPQNHKNFFGEKLFYESYPKGQDEVNELIKRYGLNTRIFYDPVE